jgi:hypothetical protein
LGAGALLFDEKICQCCSILVWIAGCWNSLLTSRNPKEQLMSLPHIWSKVQWKRSQFEQMQTVIQTNSLLYSFLHEAAQNFELLSNIQDQK